MLTVINGDSEMFEISVTLLNISPWFRCVLTQILASVIFGPVFQINWC